MNADDWAKKMEDFKKAAREVAKELEKATAMVRSKKETRVQGPREDAGGGEASRGYGVALHGGPVLTPEQEEQVWKFATMPIKECPETCGVCHPTAYHRRLERRK